MLYSVIKRGLADGGILSICESRKHSARMTLKINVGCLRLVSEMNRANVRLNMTLKINVGCLRLASEMNRAKIRLHMTLNMNIGFLSSASEMNHGNIRLRII